VSKPARYSNSDIVKISNFLVMFATILIVFSVSSIRSEKATAEILSMANYKPGGITFGGILAGITGFSILCVVFQNAHKLGSDE
jgi:hypothetical protein